MRKSSITLFILTLGAATGEAAANRADTSVTYVPGYVSHGVNVFNDEAITDYSETSGVSWFNPDPLLKEIGVHDPGAADAAVITENTDRSLPLATIRSFADFFNPAGNFNDGLFNRTLDEVGVNFFGFSSLDQRIPQIPFEGAQPGDFHRVKGAIAKPTVGEWEKAGGLIKVRCRPDGTAKVKLTLKNAFPNALYTLWDIGTLNPLTDQEQAYGVPFGGLPNVMLTDANGCGYKTIDLSYCPTQACEGSSSCSAYVSAFHHWDSQVYGGSPAGTFSGAPVGAYAANQVVWPMSGTVLIEPQNPVSRHEMGCRRIKKQSRFTHVDDDGDDNEEFED